jgi:hypothetical protein
MNDETEIPNETKPDLLDRLNTPKTKRPKIKSIDWNKLVQKEKRRAFYAGRIHSYREMVNTFHPLMSEELLECVINGLENLTTSKRQIATEQEEVVGAFPTYPAQPPTTKNPFYKPPLVDMPFMRERVEKYECAIEEALGVSLGESK